MSPCSVQGLGVYASKAFGCSASAEGESVLESLGGGAGRRSGILLGKRHGLEGRDAELLPVGADQNGCGALFLRRLALHPGSDEIVALPGDAHGLKRRNALSLHRVVEPCLEHGFGLGARFLGVRGVTTGDEDADDDEHDRNDEPDPLEADAWRGLGHIARGRLR